MTTDVRSSTLTFINSSRRNPSPSSGGTSGAAMSKVTVAATSNNNNTSALLLDCKSHSATVASTGTKISQLNVNAAKFNINESLPANANLTVDPAAVINKQQLNV